MGILQLCSPTAQERHVDKYNTTPHPVIPQSRGERNGKYNFTLKSSTSQGSVDVFRWENTSKRRKRRQKSIQPRLNPRAPPKVMEKMMGILLYFAAPRRRRDHVDRNRKHFRQRPSWSKSWTLCDWFIFLCDTTNQNAEKSTKRPNQVLLSIEACTTGPGISQHVEVASPMSIGQIATSQWEKYLTMFPPMTFKCNVVSRVWLESFSNWIMGTKS